MLLFICKIPFLGPLLFVVVFPLSVVVAGVTMLGLFLCMVLSLPAIWQGASITRALAQTFAIVQEPARRGGAAARLRRLPRASRSPLIIFGVLGFGLLPTLGMSMSIVGFGGFGMESMMAMSQGGGGGAGHAIAGAIGGALLWAVAASLVGQVYLLGLSLVYLRVTEGLDLTASEAALRATFDDARRRTAELGEKARQATQRDTGGAASRRSGRRRDGERRGRGTCAGLQPAAGVQPAAGIRTDPSRRRRAPPTSPRRSARRGTTHRPAIPTSSCPSTTPAPAPPAVPSYAAPPAWAPPPAAPAPSVAPLPAASAAAGADDVRAVPVAGVARGRLLRRLRLPAEVASRRALS